MFDDERVRSVHAGVDAPAARGSTRLVDLAAPGTGRGAALLDHVAEALEVAFHAPVVGAECGPDLLCDAVGVVLDLDGDARLRVTEAVEGDDAGVGDAAGAPPGDELVRALLGDLGVPLLAVPATSATQWIGRRRAAGPP